MTKYWIGKHYALLASACLFFSQGATAALTCQQSDHAELGMTMNYSDTDEYSRFEFIPTKSNDQWIGVVFEFFGPTPTNKLLRDIPRNIKGKELVGQITHAFKTNLEEQMPYDAISDTHFHELNGRIVTTFNTVFGESRDVRAIYGQWDQGDFQFFRTLVSVEESYDKSKNILLKAMHQMMTNCLNDET